MVFLQKGSRRQSRSRNSFLTFILYRFLRILSRFATRWSILNLVWIEGKTHIPCLLCSLSGGSHLLRSTTRNTFCKLFATNSIQRAIVRERIVIRRFRPTPLLDRLIGIHIKELCFRFAALAFRFKETVRHELCSMPASTFSCFGIILRKVPADTLRFSFFLLKTNIWEIDHFSHLFSLSYLKTIFAPDK